MFLEGMKKKHNDEGSYPLAVVEQNIYQVKPVVSLPYHQGSNTLSFNTASPLCFFVLKLPSASVNVLFFQVLIHPDLFLLLAHHNQQFQHHTHDYFKLFPPCFSLLHEFSRDFVLSMSLTHTLSPFLSSSSPLSLTHNYTHIYTYMHICTHS